MDSNIRVFPGNTAKNRPTPVTYFIQGIDGGPVKIGRSKSGGVEARLKSLQTGSPCRLVVRRVIDGDHEWQLHQRFQHLRLWGEWFAVDAELAEVAAALKVAAPPAEELGVAHRTGYVEGWAAAVAAAYDDIASETLRALERQVASNKDSAVADAEYSAFETYVRGQRERAA